MNPLNVVYRHHEAGRIMKLAGTKAMDVLPVGLTYGYACILVILLPGGRLVMMEQYNGDKALNLIAQHNVTFFPAAPPHLFDMVQKMDNRPESAFQCLRTITLSGAAASKELIVRARGLFGCEIFPLLGMSEIIGEATTPREAADELAATTVGIPIEGVAIAILDDSGHSCPIGVSGEIAVRGPSQFLGYNGEPEMTKACHNAEDWFLTGDLGFIGNEGYLRITGRKKDLIVRGGLNIDPREIEDLLIQHPLVQMAAVVGMPDACLGEKVCVPVLSQKILPRRRHWTHWSPFSVVTDLQPKNCRNEWRL